MHNQLRKHFGIKSDRYSKQDVDMQTCDICSTKFKDWYVDGKTKMGPWADMCPSCFAKVGVGLGVGKGQKISVD